MSNNSWTGYFKIVKPESSPVKMTDSQEMADSGAYNNYTWYQRLIQGSASRMTRYREYDLMDNDIEVSRALDTISEEMTGNNFKTDEPIEVDVLTEQESNVESSAVMTVKAALRRWCQIHDWETRLFHVTRTTIKYGDLFFRKNTKSVASKWQYLNPKSVIAAVVAEDDVNKILAWQIRAETEKPKSGGYSMPMGSGNNSHTTEIVPANEIVRFSMNHDLSDTAPFGESVLRTVYRSHKQKELLEDAVIIYRIQRAPERRVFYIDVGKMPPQRVKNYLETIKNEIKQKKVPTMNGGQSEIDSVYNPQSMSEDFFFASRPDGRGSRVEALPGGSNLGEVSDLEYFQRKVWRGLKVPASYMIEQQEGGQIWNDGKVGVAYIQELRFALYVERLQGHIETILDQEFKKYLKQCNIHIDQSMYRLRLPAPSNFGKYRQQEIDNSLLSTYGSADGIEYLSKRFIMKRFLQLTDEEIITNERMKREEKGIDVNDPDPSLVGAIYGSSAEGDMGMGGMGALGGGGDMGMGMDSGMDMGGDAGAGSPPDTGAGSTTP